jgi:hypothetical protein
LSPPLSLPPPPHQKKTQLHVTHQPDNNSTKVILADERIKYITKTW